MNWAQLHEYKSLWRNQCLYSYENKGVIYFALSWYYLLDRYKDGTKMTEVELQELFKEKNITCPDKYAAFVIRRFDACLEYLENGKDEIYSFACEFGLDEDVAYTLYFGCRDFKCIEMTCEEFENSYDYRRNLAWLNCKANILLANMLLNNNCISYVRNLDVDKICGRMLASADLSRINIKVPETDKRNLLLLCKQINAEFKTSDGTSLIDKYGLSYVFVDMIYLHEHKHPNMHY